MSQVEARTGGTAGDDSMTTHGHVPVRIDALDAETAALVRLAAVLAGGSEGEVRTELSAVNGVVNPVWVEEVILQTYLFAGFPRALNAAREWRRISGRSAPRRPTIVSVRCWTFQDVARRHAPPCTVSSTIDCA